MSQYKFISIANESDFFGKQVKGQLGFLSKNGFEPIAVGPSGVELKALSDTENIRTVGIKIAKGISVFKDLHAMYKLYRLFKKEKPIIVHTYTAKTGIVGMIAARLARVPIRLHTVDGIHLLDKKTYAGKMFNTIEKCACASATKVYALSEGWKEFIVENKLTKSQKVGVIGEGGINGIDTSYYSRASISEEEKQKLKDELGLTDDHFVFMYAGPLTSEEGVNELVAAFDDMKYTVMGGKSKVRLLLVASTAADPQSLSDKTIKTINKERRIITTEYQEDLRPYLAISDCLVYPSPKMGFPRKVMEAGAMGLVSIVADVSGSNEIIDQRINGVIIPSGDTEELAMAMTRLKVYDDYRNLMSENAKIMVEKRFEQTLVWEAIVEEYKSLMVSD